MGNNLSAINFEYFLIEHYKDLNISEDELAVILVLNNLLSQNNDILTAEELSFKMNFSRKKIDEILSMLVKKNIVDLEFTNKTAKMSLKPLQKKLIAQFKIDLLKEEECQKEEINKKVQNAYSVLERELGRTLSPIEISRIQEWFTINYSEEDINNAIKDLKVSSKRITIRSIDKVLLAKAKAKEISQEGVTILSDKWSKNLDETIKIAKTKWLEDE